MAKTKKEKVVKSEVKSEGYQLEVNVNDVTFKTEAPSLGEALQKFVDSPEFPFSPKTRTFIKYGKANDLRSVTLPVFRARRLFSIISTKPSSMELMALKLLNTLE